MIIELLKCQGCWRIVDQYTMYDGCTGCYTKLFRPTRPTKFNILRWILSNPKHAFKIFIGGSHE